MLALVLMAGQFLFQAGIGIDRQVACDPFAYPDTKCTNSIGPTVSLETGSSWWLIRASGGRYSAPLSGKYGEVELHGQLPVTIGPVRAGIALIVSANEWDHSVFSSNQTNLGTHHVARAAFAGLEIGLGAYNRKHIRVAFLPGYWQSTYDGTLVTPGFSGKEPLARDDFALSRIQFQFRNVNLGSRLTVSGDAERTLAWLNAQHSTTSPAVSRNQWKGGVNVSAKIWPSQLRLILRSSFTDAPGLTRDPQTSLNLAWQK